MWWWVSGQARWVLSPAVAHRAPSHSTAGSQHQGMLSHCHPARGDQGLCSAPRAAKSCWFGKQGWRAGLVQGRRERFFSFEFNLSCWDGKGWMLFRHPCVWLSLIPNSKTALQWASLKKVHVKEKPNCILSSRIHESKFSASLDSKPQ